MKNLFRISGAILLILSISFIQSCKKDKPTPPIITTIAVTAISYRTATSGGNVTNEGGAPVISRGVCWNTSTNPLIGDSKTIEIGGSGDFTSNMADLVPNIKYYVRAYATNIAGTGYGNQVSFSTSQLAVPDLKTTAITSIELTTAMSGGTVTADNGESVIAREVCWSSDLYPTTANNKTTDGTGTGSFTSIIKELKANTTYYVRAYATNSVGTEYGSTISFKTKFGIIFNPDLTYGTLTDIDGNVYKTISIGTQTWMAENLKTTKLNDGTSIPLFTDNITWQGLVIPGYCWYIISAVNDKDTYGALYNCFTVNTGKLCPTGWHVPNQAEWTVLTNYLGGEVAGNKLKETGTAHWDSPNTGASNETGFTALPGGYRVGCCGSVISYKDFGRSGNWWSSTRISTYDYSYWGLVYLYGYVYGGYRPDTYGLSVRCVRD